MGASGFWALEYFESVVSVEVKPGIDIGAAIDFLSSHFTCRPVDGPIAGIAHLSVGPIDPNDARFTGPDGTDGRWADTFVRRSAADFFTIPARSRRTSTLELVECTKTGTRFVFDRPARSVEVQLGPAGRLDLIELIRDLVSKDQESRGALPIHGTAACRPGSCVVISGFKGSGKTTILLELVEKFGYRILSGDKTFLRLSKDGSELRVAGWPDYPHVGYATIARYEGLAAIAGLPDDYIPPDGFEFSPYGKYALDPGPFRARFGGAAPGQTCRPTLVIHPSIGPGDRTRLAPVTEDPVDRAAALAHNVESSFEGRYATWQTFSVDRTAEHAETRAQLLAFLADVPAWQLTGPGDLDEAELPPEVAAELQRAGAR